MSSVPRFAWSMAAPALVLSSVVPHAASAAAGMLTIPIISGRAERQPFAGHPGWIDAYAAGDKEAVSTRLRSDATFELPDSQGPKAVIVTLDRLEAPPIIMPKWPVRPGDNDLPMTVEYTCLPTGYSEVWDTQYMVRSHEYWQTFVAHSRHLYGMMAFDGPRITWWGNKVNAAVYRDGVGGPRIDFPAPWGTGPDDNPSAHHTDHAFPRVGWRHGDVDLTPGRKYAIRVCGYKSHGAVLWDLDSFIRPDNGDGYGPGQAYLLNRSSGGDLCMILFGSLNGQLIENHIRSEEWAIFIVKRPPTKRWGQSFTNHGVSMAGLRFWGSDGIHADANNKEPLTCRIQIREDGPDGKPVGPVRIARAHDTSKEVVVGPSDDPEAQGKQYVDYGAPVVRYPNTPGQLPGHERYYEMPFDLFQAAWLPDEAPLTPGRTYYVEAEMSRPVMMFADSDAYAGGFGYYNSQKVEHEPDLMHGDPRWTLLMDIVTYENPGGAPEAKPTVVIPHKPGPDGNLLINSGAETGDFTGWTVGADPAIDPSTALPEPLNHSGSHRFGISVGWDKADMYQYQEVRGIEVGRSYVAGMWASHSDGTDECAQLLWCDGPFGGEEHVLAQTEDETIDKWARHEGKPFKPTQSTVTIIVRYKHTKPTNIASIHVDDVTLKKTD